MSVDREFSVVFSLWETLNDQQLIKDVVMKGKYLSSAIKFISERNQISIDEAKQKFFQQALLFVSDLLSRQQIHRAERILTNIQINEFHYLFDFYQVDREQSLFEPYEYLTMNFLIRTKMTQ